MIVMMKGNKLTPEEIHELYELCTIWNNLYSEAEYHDPNNWFPMDRIVELTSKGKFPVMLRVKGALKIVGPWRM